MRHHKIGKKTSALKGLKYGLCVCSVLSAGAADARRQLVPDLPSVEVHLEVLQSLAQSTPNYGGYAQPAPAATPFAQPAPIQQKRLLPVAQPAPSVRTPVQRPAAVATRQAVLPVPTSVQNYALPKPAQKIAAPKPLPRKAPAQQASPAVASSMPQAVIARSSAPFAPPAPSAKPLERPITGVESLPTKPIRSVSEGFAAPFATYEPALQPTEAVRAPVRTMSQPKAAPKPKQVARVQTPTIPKIAPEPVAAPKPVAAKKAPAVVTAAPTPAPAPTKLPEIPAPAPAATLAPELPALAEISPVTAPTPALPEPDLDAMVFEDFPALDEPIAAESAPNLPPLAELPPATSALAAPLAMPDLPDLPAPQGAAPAVISPQPIAQDEGLPALPSIGAFDAEPELNIPDPVMPSGRIASARPRVALPELPDFAPEPAMPETVELAVAPEQPAFQPPSNLPPLTAIIGEVDPSDGIVAEALPELPSELPELAPLPVQAPRVEPMAEPDFAPEVAMIEPEIVMPDPISPAFPAAAELPSFEAPQEMELAALPAPPPSTPELSAPSAPSAPSVGKASLSIGYGVEDTRLPDARKGELEALAQEIIANGSSVRILGYAGGPPEQSSLTRRVSLARVLDVRAHLINFGVPANKVTPQAMGNKGAGTSNADRVEILVQ